MNWPVALGTAAVFFSFVALLLAIQTRALVFRLDAAVNRHVRTLADASGCEVIEKS